LRKEFNLFEIRDIEQGDATHGGVSIGQAREQRGALRVRCVEVRNGDGRHGHG
jgi:hypothetical protein